MSNQFKELLVKAQDRIAISLPKSSPISVERFIEVASNEVKANPKLSLCSPQSLGAAVMLGARLGLEPDATLGHYYLVPYGKQCTPIIGYRGLIELISRSEHIKSVYAQAVYEGDTFHVELGTSKSIKHCPAFSSSNVKAVYAVAEYTNGTIEMEVMSRAQVDEIKTQQRGWERGPWAKYYESMARKTVLRRMAKYLPKAYEAQRAASIEESIECGAKTVNDYIDGELDAPVQSQTQGQRLMEELNVRNSKQEANSAKLPTHLHSDRVESVGRHQTSSQDEMPKVPQGN